MGADYTEYILPVGMYRSENDAKNDGDVNREGGTTLKQNEQTGIWVSVTVRRLAQRYARRGWRPYDA